MNLPDLRKTAALFIIIIFFKFGFFFL